MHNSQNQTCELKSNFATLPNYLTLLRIIFVPVFVLFLLRQKVSGAFLIFLLAGLTDVLDGLIARAWHQKSVAGLWLDPIADKLVIFASFFLLSFPEYAFPNKIPWAVFWIVLGRDILIVIGALLLALLKKKRDFLPTLIGKTSTVCQVLTAGAVLFFNWLKIKTGLLNWLYDLTILATIISGLQYIWIGWSGWRQGQK
ncbi:MAG TPA: CDP-alcohol phosphatidyltransferase family protein [Candidatus Saccharicenans sp.]|jgi:cardiolipin synthase|nr:CDP-alcohol phosphatidyltransferase family protein [Candidatus Saccharicenans sp.]HRD01879.1 CDP-alcohol phosphatidyltransferase family protein [Candidatus Saccharicenans sp.]